MTVSAARLSRLTNGNFVVAANGACSATWGNGTTAITGTVSTANSLLGGDLDGGTGNVQVTALTNGNYVVAFPNWEGPAGQSIAMGAVTWANGITGTTGSPSAANSLVGSNPGDQVGFGGVTALTNGNYVVTSPHWNKDEGAASWGNGSTGTSGTVSAANEPDREQPNPGDPKKATKLATGESPRWPMAITWS